jgi:hypothetical protein
MKKEKLSDFNGIQTENLEFQWKTILERINMNKEVFSNKVNEILALEYQRNKEETWVLMFYDPRYNKKYVTTIITKAIGLVSAIIKINEDLKIPVQPDTECTGFVVNHSIPVKYLDRHLQEKDLAVMKTEIENGGEICEIYI